MLTKINNKYPIELPPHRANQYKGGWEIERLDSMHKHLGKGDVIYYVGAEAGDMPALCQMWGAEVAMFEPSAVFYSTIKAIWEMNSLNDPLFFWAGFASNATTTNHNRIEWQDISSVITDPNKMGFRELSKEANNFPQISIDEVANITKPPTAISIDVEGAEFEVLKGAEYVLKEFKPKIWLSLHPEFLFDQWGVYSADVRGWLKGFGYTETLLAYEHEVHLLYV